ncbi:probable L-gulonolactone oxidase 6 [Vigna unguiculata]|uniref:probable L-gulonolactone oxidase 6 n=1 Tax=Vigna unguiculata TaxID=3917 RepID=UPI001015DB56|nr:probable L-gulonolactone oxidase 6 [Vigna unguiculata]
MKEQVLRFTLVFLFICVCGVIADPPEDPIQCASKNTKCTITNTYGMFPDRATCNASEVVYPTSEEELVAAVASASKNKRKVKVATRFSHSITKLACTDGENGLLISTKNLNKILNIDAKEGTMTVQSGVSLREIMAAAADAGLALPYAPYWWGLTIGGMMGTGAHGSTLWGKGSAVHEYVVELRIVTPSGPEHGYAKVRTLDESDPSLNAARVSLGVLGVLSQVTLKLEPLFKRSITYVTKNDSDLGDELLTFGTKHEFADVMWYPSQKKAVYRIDDRVPVSANGTGLYNFFPFRSTPSVALAVVRSTEELQEALHDANGKCISAKLITGLLSGIAYGLTNNGIFRGYPVVGYSNRMQASGTCLDSFHDDLITACPWDPRIKGEFFFQTTFSIPMSDVKNFVEDVQKLVELEPKSLCGLEMENGILMRYVTASSAYLGKSEDAVDFDLTYYRSKDPLTPRLFQDILEEIEQIGLLKYKGLPHWGKNRNLAFDGIINKYKNADKFLKVKEEYDPEGIFSSVWSDQMLGLKGGVTVDTDGCAIEGMCICSEDRHCAPKKDYLCRPGKVFNKARVCTHVRKKTKEEDDLKDEL